MSNLKHVYVTEASSEVVMVRGADSRVRAMLVADGYDVMQYGEESTLKISVSSDQGKAALLSALRDAGVCFSAGTGWSPAEVFEYLRDEGLIGGVYRRIAWRSPNDPFVEDNC